MDLRILRVQSAVPCLLLVVSLTVALPSSTKRAAQGPADAASDGSGSAPYRNSPAFLLFAIQSILLGLFLLVCGKRSWRIGTGLGLRLAIESITWAAIVNAIRPEGFPASSRNASDLIVWGIVTAAGIVGAVLGETRWFKMLGMAAMAGCGELAFSLSVVMMGDDDLPGIARYALRRFKGP